MNEYKVWQKAEVWYSTSVEANTPEDAIKLSQQDPNNTEWDIDLETVVMVDEFEVYDN